MKTKISQFLLYVFVFSLFSVGQISWASLRCEAVYSEQPLILNIEDFLNSGIDGELLRLGFSPSTQERQTKLARWKLGRLLKKFDTNKIADERYRLKITNQILNLKLSERLKATDSLNLNLNQKKSKQLNALILKSIIQNGLVAKIPGLQNPYQVGKIRKLARWIYYHPAFQILIMWRLPQKQILLTEDQLVNILENGERALETDAGLKKALSQYSRQESVAIFNAYISPLVSLGFFMTYTVHDVVDVYNQVLAGYVSI